MRNWHGSIKRETETALLLHLAVADLFRELVEFLLQSAGVRVKPLQGVHVRR